MGVTELLYEYGARTVRAASMATPADLARLKGHRAIVDFLAAQEAEEPNKGCREFPSVWMTREANNDTESFFRAAALGHFRCLKRHISQGAGLNQPNSDGIHALLLAVLHNQPLAATLLLHAGADPLIPDRKVIVGHAHAVLCSQNPSGGHATSPCCSTRLYRRHCSGCTARPGHDSGTRSELQHSFTYGRARESCRTPLPPCP